MGTQLHRDLAKRGIKIKYRDLKKNVQSSIDSDDFESASLSIAKAVIESGGSDFIGVSLTVGINTYMKLKTTKSLPSEDNADIVSDLPKNIGDIMSDLPKNIRDRLTVGGKETIREALNDVLSKRGKQ